MGFVGFWEGIPPAIEEILDIKGFKKGGSGLMIFALISTR
jgi:hypothetical protein